MLMAQTPPSPECCLDTWDPRRSSRSHALFFSRNGVFAKRKWAMPCLDGTKIRPLGLPKSPTALGARWWGPTKKNLFGVHQAPNPNKELVDYFNAKKVVTTRAHLRQPTQSDQIHCRNPCGRSASSPGFFRLHQITHLPSYHARVRPDALKTVTSFEPRLITLPGQTIERGWPSARWNVD